MNQELVKEKKAQLLREAQYHSSHYHHPWTFLSWLMLFAVMTIGAGIVAVIILHFFY